MGWNSPCSAPNKSVSSSRAVELIVLWPNVPLGKFCCSTAPERRRISDFISKWPAYSVRGAHEVERGGIPHLFGSPHGVEPPTHYWVNWGRGSWGTSHAPSFCAWSSFHQQVGLARGREMRSSWPHLPGIELLGGNEKCQQVSQDETIANG